MAVITISRQTFIGGQELGTHLARKLGYDYVTREDLAAEAEAMGVEVGRLRDSITKPPGLRQELRRERDRYVACITMLLCKRCLERNIVYNGHAGHMLLLGVPNILRISVVADLEYRINLVTERLGYSRREAKEYILGVDVVRDRWVRYLYGVDWHSPFYYDLTIHLAHTGFEHAASALTSMAELTEFQLNKYSVRALKNLQQAAAAHFKLAGDERTRSAEFHVSANRGRVQVTAQPRFEDALAHVPEVLKDLSGVRELNVCQAMDTVMFVAEQFDPRSDVFRTVMRFAGSRASAVELVTLPISVERARGIVDEEPIGLPPTVGEDEEPVAPGLPDCHDELKRMECCGGCMAFYGPPRALVPALQRRSDIRLLVLGDMYLDRSEGTRARLADELRNQLSDNLRFAVIHQSELGDRLHFRSRHAIRMAAWLATAATLLALIFVFNDQLVVLLADQVSRPVRYLSIIGVVVLAPLFAYVYGSVMRLVLRLIGVD
jgi:cytidylate kinase